MPHTMGTKTYSKSIELPETEVFRNLKNAKRFAMDIGMSAAAVLLYISLESSRIHLYSSQ